MADCTVASLHDLFSEPPAVSQELLEELERHRKEIERLSAELDPRLLLEKIDLEVVQAEIIEMIMLGSPMEPGPITAVIAPTGELVLSRKDEAEEEEIPF